MALRTTSLFVTSRLVAGSTANADLVVNGTFDTNIDSWSVSNNSFVRWQGNRGPTAEVRLTSQSTMI